MSGNSFGNVFRITTFGESHGAAIGVLLDGCPAGIVLDTGRIEQELMRRRPGQSKLTSQRREQDSFELLSGIFEGKTTGAPLAFLVRNEDVRSKDYEAIKDKFRPGHADFTYFAKYGFRDYRGGGRASARETAGRVIGGAVAKQLLGSEGVQIRGGVVQIGAVSASRFAWEQVEENPVRSVDPEKAEAMAAEIEKARNDKDSIGGIVEVQAIGVPAGLGEPVFEKLDALIASALMSIPAVKGVEIGAGFKAALLRGSEMNDEMSARGFLSNNHGGILGGISSGAPVVARIALKPTASIAKEQRTVNERFEDVTISTLGRHDPCVAPRAVPVAEAMLALVLIDVLLQQRAGQNSKRIPYSLAE